MSTKNALIATRRARKRRSASESDAVRSRNTNATPSGLMMLMSPVKPNRMSEIRLSIMLWSSPENVG
jgi:hypothetical protein